MMISNMDLDNLLGPGPHKYDEIRFRLAQACLRINDKCLMRYKTITQLEDLGLLGDNGLLKKGRTFMREQLEVTPHR